MKSPILSDGWIYLVTDDASPDAVKIGYATNVRTRLQGLQTGSATKLHLIDKIPGTRLGERALHEAFAKYRLHHEWFHDREVIEHAVDSARELIMDLAEERLGADWTPSKPGMDQIYLWVPYDPKLLVSEAEASIRYHDHGRRTGDWEGVLQSCR